MEIKQVFSISACQERCLGLFEMEYGKNPDEGLRRNGIRHVDSGNAAQQIPSDMVSHSLPLKFLAAI